jgi:quinolinate synthase
MCRYAQKDEVREMVVGTEMGIIHRLKKENPGKKFIPISEQAICPNMKLITLEKVLWSLEEMSPEVKVPEQTQLRAKASVDKMLEIGREP